MKKNSLLFLIGPPTLPPSIFRMPLGFFVTPARFSSHVYARSDVVGVKGESAAVEFVGPGFRRDGDGGAAGHPLFRIEVIGGDVDLLNALHRRDIHHVVRHGDQDVGRAVHSRVVVAAVLPVHIGGEVALRSIDDGVLKSYRRGARNQVDQALKVAVAARAAGSRFPALAGSR